MEREVLARYEHSSVGACAAQLQCYEALHYKFSMIQYNLYFETSRYDLCADMFRLLAAYELRRGMNFDESNFLFMVTAVLEKKPTAKTLKQLADAEVMRMVQAPLHHSGWEEDKRRGQQRVALRSCAGCGATEDSLRSFGKCEGCKQVVYCGRECQKRDWKAHKKACKAAASAPTRVI